MPQRHIIALSGGMASAYMASMVLKTQPNALLYFNDTKWEHLDLYRFLKDIEKALGKTIHYDTDGRDPEQVFYDQRFLGNNRVPLCSRILKAQRLQAFAKPGDVLYFGIGPREAHRAVRITAIYRELNIETRFPLIEQDVTVAEIEAWLKEKEIEIPTLYKLGFDHNNCSGGCVRQGKRQWLRLLEKLPEVYAERERLEEDFSFFIGKSAKYLKDTTLKELREKYENDKQATMSNLPNDDTVTECIGICGTLN